MPVYEYRCSACNTLRDVMHGFDEKNNEVCAACGGELVRNFNVSGIMFKGSGFYVNDSRAASPSSSDAPAKSSDSSAA